MKLIYTLAIATTVEAGLPFTKVRGGSVAFKPRKSLLNHQYHSYQIDPAQDWCTPEEDSEIPTIDIDISSYRSPVKEHLRRNDIPSVSSSSVPETTTTKKTQLWGILQGFQQEAFQRPKEDLHIGKILSAFHQMELAMLNAGMTQSARDLAGNIAKIESSYQLAPRVDRDSMSALLQWEIATGVHPLVGGHFKIQKEKSGAMGLLWLGRSLKYQYDMYRLMLREGMEPIAAAQTAFQRDLQPHLGWATSKLVKAGISAFTPSKQSDLFAMLGGYSPETYGAAEDQAIKQDLQEMLDLWQPLLTKWDQLFTDLELDRL